MRLITLSTDFGLQDWFVGTMKGVIHRIAPAANIIDLTHGIPSGDIRSGAFALMSAYQYFSRGTIHVVVVDPGVGSSRAAIALQTSNHFFVAPDNGVLSWALRKEKILNIRRLENQKCFLPTISQTFHGRDIFAPVAAHLSKGLSITKLGPAQNDFLRLTWPEPLQKTDGIHGEVLYIDRFGNAITNIPNATIPHQTGRLLIAKKKIPVRRFYQEVAPGKPVAVPGSTGFIEIAVNGGNAANVLNVRIGTKLRLQ